MPKRMSIKEIKIAVTTFNLWSDIGKHHEANNEMTRESKHVHYELLNEHTRVGRLIKSIFLTSHLLSPPLPIFKDSDSNIMTLRLRLTSYFSRPLRLQVPLATIELAR